MQRFRIKSRNDNKIGDNDHPKNADETGTTYDNLSSGALSHDNLETMEALIASNFMNPKGLPIEPVENPVLLYPPALRGAAQRIFSERAEERPGTTNRDINRFAGRYNPVEWVYLSSSFGGSNTAWYVIFPEMKMLKIIWSAKPHTTKWIDDPNELYVFSGRMLFANGASDWRCGFASTGS